MTCIKSKLVVKTATQLFLTHTHSVRYYFTRKSVEDPILMVTFKWCFCVDNFRWADFMCVWQLSRAHTKHSLPNDDNNQCVIWWWLIKRYRHTNTCHCLHHHVLGVLDVCVCFQLILVTTTRTWSYEINSNQKY